jgi:hypothetical protein
LAKAVKNRYHPIDRKPVKLSLADARKISRGNAGEVFRSSYG